MPYLLEVVSVEVDTPPAIASLTGIDVARVISRCHVRPALLLSLVIQIALITTIGRQFRPIILQAFDDVTIGINRRDVIASIGVDFTRY